MLSTADGDRGPAPDRTGRRRNPPRALPSRDAHEFRLPRPRTSRRCWPGRRRSAVVGAVFSGAIVLDCTTNPVGATVVLLAPASRRGTARGPQHRSPCPWCGPGPRRRSATVAITLAGTTFRLVRTWSSRVPTIDPGPDRLAELTQLARGGSTGAGPRPAQRSWPSPSGATTARGCSTRSGAWSASAPARPRPATMCSPDCWSGCTPADGPTWSRECPPGSTRPARRRYSAALLAAAAAGHAALEALAVLRRLHRPGGIREVPASSTSADRKLTFPTHNRSADDDHGTRPRPDGCSPSATPAAPT